MRRDMDLIRGILLTVGDSDDPVDANVFTDSAHSFELVVYHIDLIRQAGLADTNITRAMGGRIIHATVGPLTWEGNEFLDAVRSDTIWGTVKKRVASTVGATTLDVVKTLAVRIASDMLMP